MSEGPTGRVTELRRAASGSHWVFIVGALAGVGLCVAAVVQFVLTILHNQLPWPPDDDEWAAEERYAVLRAVTAAAASLDRGGPRRRPDLPGPRENPQGRHSAPARQCA